MKKEKPKKFDLIYENPQRLIIKKNKQYIKTKIINAFIFIGMILSLLIVFKDHFQNPVTFTLIVLFLFVFWIITLFGEMFYGKSFIFDLSKNTLIADNQVYKTDQVEKLIIAQIRNNDSSDDYQLSIQFENNKMLHVDVSENYEKIHFLGEEISEFIGKELFYRQETVRLREQAEKKFNQLVSQFEKKFELKNNQELLDIIDNVSFAEYAKKAAQNLIKKNHHQY